MSIRFVPPVPVDLTTCDREPIHIPGLIQPHGCLLLVSLEATGQPVVRLASENTLELLGIAAPETIGRTLDAIFQPEDAAHIARRLSTGPFNLHPMYLHAARAKHVSTTFNAVAHQIGGRIAVELEPTLPSESTDVSDLYVRLQTAMSDLRLPDKVMRVASKLASHVSTITGFDRVMVYRFDADWHGEVIAEERRADLEPFLGLHYPAADIPKQARELYTRNWLRFIPDRAYQAVGLHPSSLDPETHEPLDMSHCVLRSVSPIHLEYLKNMGVAASMSISLLRAGKLWGLVACHHYSPRRVPYNIRAACELLGQMVSLQIAHNEESEIVADVARKKASIAQIVDRLVPGPDLEQSLASQSDEILTLIQSTGAAIVMADRVVRIGQSPTLQDIQTIADLVQKSNAEIFATDHLRSHLPNSTLASVASGVLAVPFTRSSRLCVMWFRPEQVRVVNWAGDPAKSVVKGEEPARLSPRGSFALWKETVRGRSLPWTKNENAAAAEFRKAMLLKLIDHANDVIGHNALLRRASEEKDHTIDSERAARAQAERINRLTDEFVATLSHELRTPLNAIQGWVHLLRTRSGADEVAEGLDVIDRNARVQSQMVNDLLDMSRINSGKLRLDVRSVDLPDVVESALSTIQLSAEAKAIKLHKTLDPLSGVNVSGDPQRIQQIVWNLLSNAVKFTPKGGTVHVELRRTGSNVELKVRDTGVGIPPDFLPHVFDRFRQADASTTRTFGGLGLGLSIVRHLTEMHGGTIAATSPGVNSGSTFTVTLPVHALAPSPEPHPVAEVTPRMFEDGPDLTGVSLLLVEDEPDAREFIRRLLNDYNVTTTGVGSVVEALALLNDRSFDIVISDIGMPGEDGYSLIRQLRALERRRRRPRTPCIALTAYARTEDRRRLMMAGFQVHVAKPVEPGELLAVIASVSGRI